MRISKSALKITSGRRSIWCCSCCAISGQAGASASIASLIPCTMLHNGIDRNTVMKMTGLTEDDLAQIRH
ncbi:TPA: hypothetical protein G9F27_005725 [Salmonella enterica]|uniref:Uncharacterized protein n=1 Tax=Salmonella enterica TaxID=28901 RepID=A0A743SNC4_SALER|nr:hypothetical protein [Salmonella enterica]